MSIPSSQRAREHDFKNLEETRNLRKRIIVKVPLSPSSYQIHSLLVSMVPSLISMVPNLEDPWSAALFNNNQNDE